MKSRIGVAAVLIANLAGCGGSASPTSPSGSTDVSHGTFLYTKGVDGVWGFSVGSAGQLQPVPGSPMALANVPSFRPGFQFASVLNGPILTLHTISGTGLINSTPTQSINLTGVFGAASGSGLFFHTVWNPQGDVLAVAGPTGVGPMGMAFYSFSNGQLTLIPGSPVPAGTGSALWPVFAEDGVLYAITSGPDGITSYRVSTGRAALLGFTAFKGPRCTLRPVFLSSQRILVCGIEAFARETDGTLRPAGPLTRNVTDSSRFPYYSLKALFRISDTTIIWDTQRRDNGRFETFFSEAVDPNGNFTSASPDGVYAQNSAGFIETVARGGRVLIHWEPSAQRTPLKGWLIDGSGPHISTVSPGGQPFMGTDPSGQFSYVFVREVPGIPALRVSEDGTLVRFDPLPAGVNFQYADGFNSIQFIQR